MKRVERLPGVIYTALVPNIKSCRHAIICNLDKINLLMSASESDNRANLRMSSEQSLEQFAEIVKVTRGSPVAINAAISTAFGYPFHGLVPQERIFYIVERCITVGITGVTLCDMTGMADPAQVFDPLLSGFGERLARTSRDAISLKHRGYETALHLESVPPLQPASLF